jgi:hypothetical protein
VLGSTWPPASVCRAAGRSRRGFPCPVSYKSVWII